MSRFLGAFFALFFLLPLLALHSFSQVLAAPARAIIALPQTITFEGQLFPLVYAAKDAKGIWLNEYILKGNTLKDWQKMLIVRSYDGVKLTPKQLALNIVRNLQSTNPAAKYALTEDDETGEILLDFFTWTPDPKALEFNVFKITTKNKTVVSYQFSYRHYDGMQTFTPIIKANRHNWLEALIYTKTPTIIRQRQGVL